MTSHASITGQMLTHYEVLEQVGEGGMGVVYKARDTQLDRVVAIKVLGARRIAEPSATERFLLEAKAASALNHPNIVTIYGLDRADDVDFIAMEYVAGQPLDRLMARGRLPLSTILRYAVQVADALATAHAAGIVHRDLKPSNVMVTGTGLVKVLDFGLAKLTESKPGEVAATGTRLGPSTPGSEEGFILGTLAYMSPEQAEGRPVDARSDIFSLGSMLYEMVTGSRAFDGPTTVSTLSAILRDEPKTASTIVQGLPKDIERVIVRCLRKDPSRRFQHMADVKVELEELKEESESGLLAAVTLAPRTRRWRAAGVAMLAGLSLIAAVAAWLVWGRQARGPASEMTALPLTTFAGIEDFPTFAPDGTQVAFMWNGPRRDNFDIYVKLVGPGPPPLRLTTDAATDSSPAWSPDGANVAFLRDLSGGRFAIMLIAPLGGQERRLAEISSPFAALGSLAWSADGRFLAVPDRESPGGPSAIFLFSIETGARQRLTSPPAQATDDYAQRCSAASISKRGVCCRTARRALFSAGFIVE